MIHFVAVRRGKPARQAARSGRSSAGKENLGHELPYGKLALPQVLLCEKAQQKFLRFGPLGRFRGVVFWQQPPEARVDKRGQTRRRIDRTIRAVSVLF